MPVGGGWGVLGLQLGPRCWEELWQSWLQVPTLRSRCQHPATMLLRKPHYLPLSQVFWKPAQTDRLFLASPGWKPQMDAWSLRRKENVHEQRQTGHIGPALPVLPQNQSYVTKDQVPLRDVRDRGEARLIRKPLLTSMEIKTVATHTTREEE